MENKNNGMATGCSKNTDTSEKTFLQPGTAKTKLNAVEAPAINLPKGGGAIKGIDEKFSVNAVNGTASFSVPLPFSAARGASPSLAVSYNSGSGNGIFGLGWSLSLPSIKRKTDKGLPRYFDDIDSDIFMFSEVEDLVPEFKKETGGRFIKDSDGNYIINEKDSPDGLFVIRYYRPRIEGLFARIERWTAKNSTEIKWRITTRENVTTLFGWSAASRLANPADNSRIFEWMPEFSFDDKGNCIHYLYKKEDEKGFDAELLHNRNRTEGGKITYTNIYLEKVLYGNKTPYKAFGDAFPAATDYLFSTIFDYGEYSLNSPYAKNADWKFRPDAFSDYRAGFEVRTTCLCRRVMLFHHFTGTDEYNGLVKSLDFEYDTSTQQGFTYLKSITNTGYIKQADGSYTHKSLPPVEYEYQKHDWNKEVKTISTDDLLHAPAGLTEPYRFTDLYNEGLSGILSEQAGGWYYKHNLGNGTFEAAKPVSPKPSFSGLDGSMQLVDLDADGGKQFLGMNAEPRGYFELDDDNTWQAIRYFESIPNVNLADANTKMLDLDGDGRADILISEDHVFTWYPSQGRKGFAAAQTAPKPYDEEKGPHVVFADELQSIFLADMNGDGLTDIVRIRNGEVCYWPNTGYGTFGARVAMDNAPVFDAPDAFNPAWLQLADIDGSGTADIIYLGKNTFTCWMNHSGNAFGSAPFEIESFPEIHNNARVSVTDLLGNGVACIVWTTALAKDSITALRYIDLMNSRKPHIMVSSRNNMGKETHLTYVSSTKFYIEDKLAGRPWITKLHFPVHCVAQVETLDKISGYRFINSYKYHHGYYDHAEREFRGFGRVERMDSEHFEHWVKGSASNIVDETLHQEPVVSKSWHHTGAFLSREKILSQFADEYWYKEAKRQGFDVAHHEAGLPDARLVAAPGIGDELINNFNFDDWQQALRACKGMGLRTETFARDAAKYGNSEDARRAELMPYTVGTHNCVIELIQPRGNNKYAVFAVKESESITYSYERKSEDPRIAHTLNIKLDDYGNVLESASVVYPRRLADGNLPPDVRQEQDTPRIIYTKNNFTNDVISDVAYRLRLPSEVLNYELKGVSKTKAYYTPQDFENILDTATEVYYHQVDANPPAGIAQKRLIEHAKSIFYNNNLNAALQLHRLESLAIPYESYHLAYTPELLYDIYGTKVTAALMTEGKFMPGIGDDNWWIRSGTTQFIEGSETSAQAQNRFYAPVSFTDPYGAKTRVKYYGNYMLFVESTEDALGNKSKIDRFNFRTLSAQRMQDINGNISEAISDELGMVKATVVFGKGSEADDLSGFSETTDMAEIAAVNSFFNAADSVELTNKGKDLLKHATSRFVYNLDVYKNNGKPVVVCGIAREEHYKKNANSPVKISFEYSNGMGQVILKKVQAQPGLAKKVVINTDNSVSITEVDTAAQSPAQLRWIGNGRTIVNNKGNAVKQYEPYFSVTHRFEDVKELVETGVTPLMYYDAAGRLMKTEMPDGTFSKVEFDSWKQAIYDANDTVTESRWYDERINRRIDARLLAAGRDPQREKVAAEKAARHAGTPAILHFDTLGRPIFSIDHNRNIATGDDEYCPTKAKTDIEGNLRQVTDARGNRVMQYKYDMLGNPVYHNSMDAGQCWLLINILGNPLRTWDERYHEVQYSYDILHRPTESRVLYGDEVAPLNNVFEKIIYGESLLTANRSNEAALKAKNILGKPIKHFDTGGLISTPEYDFKGQPTSTTRRLFALYKETANWTDAAMTDDLESDNYTFTTQTDALGRITRQTAPDGSVITPGYNRTGLLTDENVRHPGDASASTYLKNIDYNEKGQRSKVIYGNDVITRYYYDAETFRLNRLETKRKNGDPLQDFYYTYDAVGNITHVEDKNIPVTFFNNQKTTGVSEYTYDALYRLVEATGRENTTALSFGNGDNWQDAAFLQSFNAGDPMNGRAYKQNYTYDTVGNIIRMRHAAPGNNWTRDYAYETANNRLTSTRIDDTVYNYPHHAEHGFITKMPHLDAMGWNFKEELVMSARQHRTDGGTPKTTYYQYDGQGQRIRKITENAADSGYEPDLKNERIYIAGFELYISYSGADEGLERTSLSLIDGGHRFVMVDIQTEPKYFLGFPIGRTDPEKTVRYQAPNHLGSVSLELDESAAVITYEEYHPFGTTAFQAKNRAIKAAAKRYRYTGMERDDETGLEYHSARYYIPWLGRWCSCDPIGIGDGVNVYRYARNSPIASFDTSGKQSANDIGMDMMWTQMGREMSAIWTSVFGGSAYISPQSNTVDISAPRGGVGGVTGGVVRAATFRMVPIEDNPTPSSLMGMELGAGFVPVADPAARLVTGESVTHLPASRLEAGVLLALDVVPFALELRAARIEARAAAGGARLGDTSVSLAYRPGVLAETPGPIGHNMVGINTGGGTRWTHLVIDEARTTSGIVTGGDAYVVRSTRGPGSGYVVLEVPVSPESASRAASLAERRVATGNVGEYGLFSRDCTTYASEVLGEAGVFTPRVSTPALNAAAVALSSPRVLRPVARAAAVVATVERVRQIEDRLQMSVTQERANEIASREEALQMSIDPRSY